ncbi:purple acid phosphatase family protein [Sorangium atrum]|uniref:acid phosphatase n=1 Tax=Sorangium atrum TaxID=2995308 RepID=A0ABT5BU68_9BACT|nr:tartrate-resistant acid phosphatase type 5 family protein [Sorangium aterium]MDC0677694.1 tartrate-resistant acid phosphatase type 5 family protein [Sorangium aterium]
MKPLRAARPLAISKKSLVALVLSASPAIVFGAGCGVADSVPIPSAGALAGAGDEPTSTGAASSGAGPSGGIPADHGPSLGAAGAQAIGTVVSHLDVVRIIAIGDTGEGNLAQNQVADRMSEKCIEVGGCHAVMMNGDNFYDNGVADTGDAQWGPKFEQPYDRAGLNGLPFYAVLGNHDHGPSSNGVRQAQIDYSQLPVGDGPGMRMTAKWHMPASYYDVRVGDVHLFGIDTVDFTSDDQARDMSARVAASDATWKIVFGHHPRYTSGAHASDNPSLGMSGMFAMQQAIYCGADMYMAGHDHNLEFIDKGRDEGCPSTYFAISGAGSKTRPVSPSVPTERGQLFFTDKTEGFAYLRFEGRSLLFEFIDKQGAVIFTKTISK